MRVGVAILLMLIAVASTVYGIFLVCQWVWRRRKPWTLVEESTAGAFKRLGGVPSGQSVELYAQRPGCERLLVSSVSFAADDFDSQIYEARAQARMKVYALNSGRKRKS